MLGQKAFDKIEQAKGRLVDISLKMWQHPEGPYREYKACEWISEYLKEEGFEVEVGVAGVPTAIKATWGSGSPAIGLLGELDALPGLSQKVETHQDPIDPNAYGQGCGHNMLGVGALGGAIGLKAEMEASGLAGRVVYFGCPAEEVLTGKSYMARGGAFNDIDYCVEFHPGSVNVVHMGRTTALNSANFHFKGVTAHAGGDPYNGRSALDAVELMNVGANYLREHVTSDVRIHYIITDGGVAPNIVPDRASSKYFVRAFTRETCNDVYERLVRIAKGAAMMTDTEVEIEYLGGCYERLPNLVLSEVMQQALEEAPREAWTAEELQFARELNATRPDRYQKQLEEYELPEGTELCDSVLPISYMDTFGSTDVGDVQHIVPGVSFGTAAWNLGAPGHSWQVTACAGHSIGMKGMIYACKTIALFDLKVLENPEILHKARAEFDKKMAGKQYVCPITPEMLVP